MAIPTYVSAGTAASGTGALTPGIPGGIAANDILLLMVNNTFTTTTAATLSDAQGFAAVGSAAIDSGSFGGIHAYGTLFWKRATGSDAAPTVADNGEYNVARIYAFNGCISTGNPWDVVSTDGDADGDSTLTMATGATTTVADTLVCVFTAGFTQAGETLGSWTNADLANITERDDTSYALGEDIHLALITGEKATAGAYGATTASWTTNGVYWVSAGITIALKPDATTITATFDKTLGALTLSSQVAVADLATGTTLDALQAGSSSFKWVAAIEGYEHLLTDATAAQATNAWAGISARSHYTQALSGLVVKLANQQQFDWRNPFPRGGTLTLHVTPDASDTFGIDVSKRNLTTVGSQTELTRTLDRDETTSVDVKSTTGFPSSGEIWIGTECIGYAGVTATKFIGLTRGKYAPLLPSTTGTLGGVGWSETHRAGSTGPLGVKLNPQVTSYPKHWIGKWVALYLHKYDASIPALNAKADALREFAGRIVAISDDPNTGATVVEIKHALDCVTEATIGGRDQWRARIANRFELREGAQFRFYENEITGAGGVTRDADELTVVPGAPADANEVQAGFYTAGELFDALNLWLSHEKDQNRIEGTYTLSFYAADDGLLYTRNWWIDSNITSGDSCSWRLGFPAVIRERLGYNEDSSEDIFYATTNEWFRISYTHSALDSGNTFHTHVAPKPYYKSILASLGSSTGGSTAIIENQEGEFSDQWFFMPSSFKAQGALSSGGKEWGIFIVDNRILMFGYRELTGSTWALHNFAIAPDQFGLDGASGKNDDRFKIPARADQPDYISIRQVFIIETILSDFLSRVFRSTGTTSYNDATWDALPLGLGIGMPYDIFDELTSTLTLPHADKPICFVIDKPTKLSSLLAGELAVRRSSLRWKSGRLEFVTWQTPLAANAIGTLSESNKAAPIGHIDPGRSVTVEDGQWPAPLVTLQYNRSLTGSSDGKDAYRDSVTFADAGALDDLGGDAAAITFNLRGTFGDFHGVSTSPDSLAAGYLASMPVFSRPARIVSRSIDQRYFEGYSIGDVVLFTDAFARDPETGRRGVSARPAIILSHSYSLGGFEVNSDSVAAPTGTVNLLLFDSNRVAAYVPTMQVDETEGSGGRLSVDPDVFAIYPNKYTESVSGDTDLAHFEVGDSLTFVEIDPADPTAPETFTADIASIDTSGSPHELTIGSTLDEWDDTKRYRIVYGAFGIGNVSQQTKTYQADDDDVLIADTRVPFEYGIGGAHPIFTAWSGSDDVELPPNAAYGDGVGRDTGHEIATVRLLNNLMSYKTAVSSPCLSNNVYNTSGSISFVGSTWYCVQCRPIHLGDDVLLDSAYREISVAPFYRSGNGSSASLRVTLSLTPPSASNDWMDVDRGVVISEATFGPITSTTWQTATAQTLNARVKGIDGVAWIYVEVNVNCETRGLALVQEGPLVY